MTWFYLLTGGICFVYIMLILSYSVAWRKTPVFHGGISYPLIKISIILPVRNEEKNISAVLTCLMQQNYPHDKFEVIIVDDFSTDSTPDIIKKNIHSNIKYIALKNGQGKKSAITAGILQAEGTLIITTDADCTMKNNWLSTIAAFYEKERPKMIIAPVLLNNKKESSFAEHIQSQEMLILTTCGGASLYYNLPILCSGANLAYEKESFITVNGFEGVDKSSSGDDVLLMQKIYTKYNKGIKYLKSTDAIVYTAPEKSLFEALSQRKRWASKFFSYGFNHIAITAILIFLINFLVVVMGMFAAINSKYAALFIVVFMAKLLADGMLFYSASLFFKNKIRVVTFIANAIFYPVYVTLIGIISPFTNYSWKGRKSH